MIVSDISISDNCIWYTIVINKNFYCNDKKITQKLISNDIKKTYCSIVILMNIGLCTLQDAHRSPCSNNESFKNMPIFSLLKTLQNIKLHLNDQ